MSEIPFEAQIRDDGCAAAVLAMVGRSFGLSLSQQALWPAVTQRVRGEVRGRTHLIARHALSLGLQAAIVQPLRPWETLLDCHSASVRSIVHLRLEPGEGVGHYCVVTGIDATTLELHDPLRGPSQQLCRERFLSLWAPKPSGGEVVGHVLVAITNLTSEWTCPQCRSACPSSICCIGCGSAICLRPSEVIGCPRSDCAARRFEACYCPGCDMSTWWLNPVLRGQTGSRSLRL